MTKEEILKILTCLDLTRLNTTDTFGHIAQLIEKANTGFEHTVPAAVCVYSNYADLIQTKLHHSINGAVVAGYFPSGQAALETKIQEYHLLAQTHINEVDLVINRGELIARNYDYTANEIRSAREILSDKTIKIIIESGELNGEQIKLSSQIAIDCGADFIKTSTGKGKVGATQEAVKIICNVIKDKGKKVGIKISGGIKTIKDAQKFITDIKENLGDDYIEKSKFRIGASNLYDQLVTSYHSS